MTGSIASEALADARPSVYWLDRERPVHFTTLGGGASVDLVIVGAGFTGLWAAIQAKQDDPARSVMVIEAGLVADQASGRNGGFCSSSLTHGLDNGVARFPKEMVRIEALARANFEGIAHTIDEFGIDCDWQANGTLAVATAPWLVEGVHDAAELARKHGYDIEEFDAPGIRAELNSPTFHGGSWQRDGEAQLDPARLGWGLAAAATALGVVIHERTPMLGLERSGAGMSVRTESGTVRCGAVILATNAFRSPVGAINRLIAPVYDYVLATEPLSAAQLASIGWRHRQGVSDTTNQFHYYRITEDNRIIWGGYDAIYHYGSKIDPRFDQRDETQSKLAEHFFETFPQLEGVRFTHRWGGVIDTCTRFSATFGTSFDGRVSYAVGYTGLGVGASRFGARVSLDHLYRPDSELLSLRMVRRGAIPFPPEPIRWIGIELTRRALARADANRGARGPWLRLLDALGLGFDS